MRGWLGCTVVALAMANSKGGYWHHNPFDDLYHGYDHYGSHDFEHHDPYDHGYGYDSHDDYGHDDYGHDDYGHDGYGHGHDGYGHGHDGYGHGGHGHGYGHGVLGNAYGGYGGYGQGGHDFDHVDYGYHGRYRTHSRQDLFHGSKSFGKYYEAGQDNYDRAGYKAHLFGPGVYRDYNPLKNFGFGGYGGEEVNVYRKKHGLYPVDPKDLDGDGSSDHLVKTKHKIDEYIAKQWKLGKRKLAVSVSYGNVPLEYQYLEQYHGFPNPLAGKPLGKIFGVPNVSKDKSSDSYGYGMKYKGYGIHSAPTYGQGYSDPTPSYGQGYSDPTPGYMSPMPSSPSYTPSSYTPPSPSSYSPPSAGPTYGNPLPPQPSKGPVYGNSEPDSKQPEPTVDYAADYVPPGESGGGNNPPAPSGVGSAEQSSNIPLWEQLQSSWQPSQQPPSRPAPPQHNWQPQQQPAGPPQHNWQQPPQQFRPFGRPNLGGQGPAQPSGNWNGRPPFAAGGGFPPNQAGGGAAGNQPPPFGVDPALIRRQSDEMLAAQHNEIYPPPNDGQQLGGNFEGSDS